MSHSAPSIRKKRKCKWFRKRRKQFGKFFNQNDPAKNRAVLHDPSTLSASPSPNSACWSSSTLPLWFTVCFPSFARLVGMQQGQVFQLGTKNSIEKNSRAQTPRRFASMRIPEELGCITVAFLFHENNMLSVDCIPSFGVSASLHSSRRQWWRCASPVSVSSPCYIATATATGISRSFQALRQSYDVLCLQINERVASPQQVLWWKS